MKKIYYILMLLGGIVLFNACDDLMDTHKEFIKGGEIIYAPKPYHVVFIAGKNRVEANYIISKAPNVSSINIYWNSNRDSLITPLNLPSGEAVGKILLEGLEEKPYTFTIQLRDKFGHPSLPVLGFGTAYGENYQNSLSERRINNMQTSDGGGTVEWNIAQEGLVRNEIKYTDKDGNEVSMHMDAAQNSLFCPNISSGSTIDYRSVFIPEAACIDTFFTAWKNSEETGMHFPHAYTYAEVDRSNWEIIYYDNTDPEEGSPQNMIDGNEGSYWHSNYHDATRYPYTFIIDMKENTWVGMLGAMQRRDVFYSRGMTFYLTDDADYAGNPNDNNWTYLGDLELKQENGMQWQTISNEVAEREVSGRYLKIVFTSGYNNEHLGAIAELSVQRIATVDGKGVSVEN